MVVVVVVVVERRCFIVVVAGVVAFVWLLLACWFVRFVYLVRLGLVRYTTASTDWCGAK